MTELEHDIETCKGILDSNYVSKRGEGKLYCNTNEDLNKILLPKYITNKNVLTVLASSDQLFSCYHLNAKSVDTFDSNKLAYYYYFLKKWSILKTGYYYISAYNGDLKENLEMNNGTKEEEDAYRFWSAILDYVKNSSLYYSNLFYKYASFEVPYKNDISKVTDMITHNDLNFVEMNLFEEVPSNKKYDTIILSNILEYLYEEDTENFEIKSEILKDNLKRLTHEGSIIISTNILDFDYEEINAFKDDFIYEEGMLGHNGRFYGFVPLYYTLRRK